MYLKKVFGYILIVFNFIYTYNLFFYFKLNIFLKIEIIIQNFNKLINSLKLFANYLITKIMTLVKSAIIKQLYYLTDKIFVIF